MSEKRIREHLIQRGEVLFKAPHEFGPLTKLAAADELVSDLAHHPHAFVLASIMDQQVMSERAWLIPFRLKEKLGRFSMELLLKQSESTFRRLMTEPQCLHRFADKMAVFLFRGIKRIADQYHSDASQIWKGRPSSAKVVYSFLEFDGVGPKIATMAANVLARRFKVEFADYYSIDISADVHVRRVFGRLGLTPPDATSAQLIFRARALHPEFPGLMDFPAWEIGKRWCRPTNPECGKCYMNDVCQWPQSENA